MYLTGSIDSWNDAKRAEVRDRVKHGIDESPEDNPAIGDADDNQYSNDEAIAFADEPAESDYVNIYGRGRVYDPKLAKAFREIWASEDDEEYDI